MQTNFISGAIGTLSPVSLAIALATLFITLIYFIIKKRSLPPGPAGLPYFGYWPFINDNDFHLKLDALKKQHGDVFSFNSTGRLYINLGSIKAVREALISKSEFFGDRISDFSLFSFLFKDGVAFINGESWKVVRKFFLVLLKERGANSIKTSIAGPLYDSIKSTINDIKAKKGDPFNLIELLTDNCNTILRLTLFGETGATEEQIRKFNEMYGIQIQCMTPRNSLLSGKFARYFIFPFMPNSSEMLKCHKKMEKMLYDIINEHKTTYDAENPRDIIDEYFKERDKRRSKGDLTAEYFTDKTLMGSLMQFMGDGVLAVASFTSFLIKNLLEHPEEQEKVYKEIVEVIGLERQPTIEDKSKLTYFNAYILEALRTADFFNFFPSQECVKETTLGGHKVPKGAMLLVNFYSCHHDPEVYEEPEKFNPSRFIHTEGKKRPELPITFGVGKRSCLGEGFVMMQVFLLLTTLIQNLHLSLPEGSKKPTYEEFMSSNLLICAKPRDTN
ncbi:Cytochrome P450 2B12 [Araneus ventricosus]|uniref:Cytochrome P450 2B12 n=1 Tax=Araneus ventricosus TaxID=182803 RepID=A0A4Y2IJ19_ARAVE|nr:Cytochrome P450 2B12 [Araneus ventricosus]